MINFLNPQRFVSVATSLALAGSGTITVSGSGTMSVTEDVALTGSGTIALGGTGTISTIENVALTGSGTIALGGTGTILTTENVALSGSGTIALGGTGTVSVVEHVALTGSGTIALGGTGTLSTTEHVALTGSGTIALGGTGTLSTTENVALSGTGTIALGGTGTISTIEHVALSGSGTIALSGTGTISTIEHVAVSGSGTIALGGTGTVSVVENVALSGSGTIALGGTGTATVVTIVFNNYSLDFDGTNDYLSTSLVTNTYSLKDGFSASLWVKLDDVSTTQDFFGRYGNGSARFYFGISGTYVRAAIGNSWNASTITHGMSTGTWYHIAYTFSGGSSGTFTYYLNGSSVGTRAYTWTADSSSYEPMHIGGLKNGSNLHQNPTNGKLDEFALYNSTLSASDIAAIYNSGAPANQSSDSNLVAYWRMEENTGTTVADSSSNSNTATLNNGPTFSTDVPVFNQFSIDLDGLNDYLSVSDHNDFSFGNSTSDSAFSVSAWIKMDDATKFRIFSKQTNSANIEYVFGVDGLDRLGVNLYDGATSNFRGVYSSSIQSYEGSWIHVVMTYDGTGGSTAYNGMKLYLNGSALSTSNNQGGGYAAMHNTSTDVWIGGANFVPDYADGKMDEVAVFSAELTSTQVSNIYNSGTPTDLSSESNLVGYWRMEENTGTTVVDSSGNGHTATLTNGPTFNTDTPS